MYDGREILVWEKIFFLTTKALRNERVESFYNRKAPKKIGALYFLLQSKQELQLTAEARASAYISNRYPSSVSLQVSCHRVCLPEV